MSAPEFEAKPYKGAESYKVEDAEVFFGRDGEADQLIAKILSSRFTLVYAQSGAGKTSLINARVIPGLEAKGWSTVRILPQNDPVASIRETTLAHVLPPPAAELEAFRRAKDALVAPGEDSTLNELLDRYDRLEIRDARRRLLAMPVEVRPMRPGSLPSQFAHFNPLFCRVLRSQIEADGFVEHLGAIRPLEPDSEPFQLPLSGESLLSELEATLSDPALAAGYGRLLAEVNVPLPDLSVFFKELTQIYGSRVTRFALVLIIDQFEELFTRFIDPGPLGAEKQANSPDWRLRWELFDQLERLYRTQISVPGAPAESAETPLPIRFVISIRNEYIAQLDQIRRFVGGFDDNCYHLNLLEKGQAAAAVREPAILFGYNYQDDCFSEIIAQLLKEDRFVEPAHLQLVCEKLWNERGRELAAASLHQSKESAGSEHDSRTAENRIELAAFEELGGVKGILRSFFKDFLALQLDSAERLETLEMLELLVTANGTRNIVEYDQLVNAPLRDRSRRQGLLRNLINRTIVRTERRLGGYFVEITHEFLIGPILEAIRSDREAKAAREFLAAKVPAFEQTLVPLTPGDLVYLYRHRRKIHPTEQELGLLLASMLHNIEMKSSSESPGAYWLAKSAPKDLLHQFIQIEHWASEERGSLCPSRAWAETFPLSGLESQFAALAADPAPFIRTICAQWISRTKRDEDLPMLGKLVNDANSGVRLAAAEALTKFSNEGALPLLRQLAKEPDWGDMRLKAMKALANFSKKEDLPLLRELARDEDSGVRLAALEALKSFSKEEALPLLRELVRDEFWDVRAAALRKLASLSGEEDLPLLRELAKGENWNVGLTALKALTSFSKEEEALPLLRKLAKDQELDLRAAALKALASFSKEDRLPLLSELAKDHDSGVRLVAVDALAGLSKEEALPLLRELARDQNWSVRAAAMKALESFSKREDLALLRELDEDQYWDAWARNALQYSVTKDQYKSQYWDVGLPALKALANSSKEEDLPLLRDLVKDQDSGVRLEATKALASFCKEGDLPLLRELAKDRDSGVRAAALPALESLSKEEDLPLLRKLAKDQDSGVRAAVLKVLAGFSKEEDLPLLGEMAKDRYRGVRLAVVAALASFSKESALPLLHELVKDRDSGVRLAGLEALASFSKESALPLLRELSKDRDWGVRLTALKALASFSKKEDVPLLRELSEDRDWDVRLAAVEALASFSKEDALPLLRGLANDLNWDVRAGALKALAGFSKQEDLPMLRQLAKDEDSGVRAAAVEALESFSREEDLPLLRELAKDQDSRVRAAAMRALASLSKEDVLPLLRDPAKDQDSGVRAAAMKALKSFSKQEDLPLLRELALVTDYNVAAEAVRGLASLCSHEELEAFLNQHDHELCARALAALDDLLYMPKWLMGPKDEESAAVGF
jgi:HEAT repeat protein